MITDKIILTISRYGLLTYNTPAESNKSQIWARPYANMDSVSLISLEDFNNLVKNNKHPLKDGDVLYFRSDSKYPRFKLKSSSLKRCIKPEKSTCIVFPNYKTCNVYNNVIVAEDKEYVYFIDNYSSFYHYSSNNKQFISDFAKDPYKTLLDNNLFLNDDVELKYKGECIAFDTKLGYDDFINRTIKDIVFDSDVDKFVNKDFDVLSLEETESINDLLASKDKLSNSLGLKMLIGYNVQETPLTIELLLGRHYNIQSLPELYSVGVKQILSSLKLNNSINFYDSPTSLYWIISKYDIDTLTEKDKELSRYLIVKYLNEFMELELKEYKSNNYFNSFNIKFDYNIE